MAWQSRLQIAPQGTHWRRKSDGTKLCFFCKRPLEGHLHCKLCTVLIHHPNQKYPEEVQSRFHRREVCEFCSEKLKSCRKSDI